MAQIIQLLAGGGVGVCKPQGAGRMDETIGSMHDSLIQSSRLQQRLRGSCTQQ